MDSLQVINLKSLRAIRKFRGISMAELSRMIGVDVSVISTIESGKANPTVKTLDKICMALGITVSFCMTE